MTAAARRVAIVAANFVKNGKSDAFCWMCELFDGLCFCVVK